MPSSRPRSPTVCAQCSPMEAGDREPAHARTRRSPLGASAPPDTRAGRDDGIERNRIFGELAERQGTAVLTRRDLRVGQVRLLHSPPYFMSNLLFL